MVWRDNGAPGQGPAVGALKRTDGVTSSAKITVLLVVMTFLVVTIALIALQPRPEPAPPWLAGGTPETQAPAPQAAQVATPAKPAEPVEFVAAPPQPAPAPRPEPKPAPVVEQSVTRADASLLELRQASRSTEASVVLRQLASSTGTGPDDLPLLARNVLDSFGYPVRRGDRLHALLVASLSNQKSDAYIDALLNTAAARGEFSPPFALVLPTGRMDTNSLLQAMVRAARG